MGRRITNLLVLTASVLAGSAAAQAQPLKYDPAATDYSLFTEVGYWHWWAGEQNNASNVMAFLGAMKQIVHHRLNVGVGGGLNYNRERFGENSKTSMPMGMVAAALNYYACEKDKTVRPLVQLQGSAAFGRNNSSFSGSETSNKQRVYAGQLDAGLFISLNDWGLQGDFSLVRISRVIDVFENPFTGEEETSGSTVLNTGFNKPVMSLKAVMPIGGNIQEK